MPQMCTLADDNVRHRLFWTLPGISAVTVACRKDHNYRSLPASIQCQTARASSGDGQHRPCARIQELVDAQYDASLMILKSICHCHRCECIKSLCKLVLKSVLHVFILGDMELPVLTLRSFLTPFFVVNRITTEI